MISCCHNILTSIAGRTENMSVNIKTVEIKKKNIYF